MFWLKIEVTESIVTGFQMCVCVITSNRGQKPSERLIRLVRGWWQILPLERPYRLAITPVGVLFKPFSSAVG